MRNLCFSSPARVLLPLWLALFSIFAQAGDKKLRMEEVASKLSCYCGTCPHLVVTECGCSTADQIKVDIQKMIDSGMSEDEIIQSYVAQYGQTVLSAPPKSGFNLTVWVLPFLAFIAGGAVLVTFLKRQQVPAREQANEEETVAKKAEEQDEYYRKLLKKELDERK